MVEESFLPSIRRDGGKKKKKGKDVRRKSKRKIQVNAHDASPFSVPLPMGEKEKRGPNQKQG